MFEQAALSATQKTMHWGAQEGIAFLVVVGIVLIAWALYRLARRGRSKANASVTGADRGGLMMGFDKRVSTSKTVALLWTFVVAYMVLVVLFVALSRSNSMDVFAKTLGKASALYLVFLGGPYAAAVIAKLNVTNNPNVQKSDGSGTFNPVDVIANDAGALDLYDFQYTMFNLIAMFAMVVLFLGHPALGFPAVPGFLAALTGGSAAVYSANKVARTNPPKLSSLSRTFARVGESVTLYGEFLLADGDPSGTLTITIGDGATSALARVSTTDATAATFAVPSLPPGQSWPAAAQKVVVTTPDGAKTTDDIKLLIVPDKPVIKPLGIATAQQATPITITGEYFLDVSGGGSPIVTLTRNSPGPLAAPIPCVPVAGAPQTDESLQVQLPSNVVPAGAASATCSLVVSRQGAVASDPVALTVVP